MEAQTNIAFLQSELDTLKSDLADQSLNSERYDSLTMILIENSSTVTWICIIINITILILGFRDLEMIREYTEDRDSLERQIEILQ